jgi:hypothetical protein
MSEQSKTISREELYQQLWKVPISRLAIQLGYSYLELLKICADLRIPRPTGGYWYRLKQGGASEQVPLPPIPERVQTEIPFGRRLHEQPPPEPPTYVGKPEEEKVPASAAEVPQSPTIASNASSTGSSKIAAPVRVAPNFPDVVEMTRDELHKHVWTTPIQLLSEALGLSDIGLAKTCRQMEVPKPGRGYWARLDAGQSVEQIQLPPPSAGAVRKWTFDVAANRRRRADWAANNFSAPIKGNSSPRLALPGEQEPLHEIAERHRVAFEKAKPDENGFVSLDLQTLFRCEVSAVGVPRLIRAIHALVAELEARNCRLARGNQQFANLSAVRGDDRLPVHWREALEEIEREPTAEEKRKPSWTWQLKQKRATGQLTVEVSATGLRGQRSWTESQSKPIEEVLARVMEKIAAAFEGLEAQRQREAERQRQQVEYQQQRAEQEAKQEKERQEQERLTKHQNALREIDRIRRFNLGVAAQKWEDSERVLAFLAALERHWRGEEAAELSLVLQDWLTWARTEATKLTPWSDGYPDPESTRRCDPKTMPIGGPYPAMSVVKPHEFSNPQPKPDPSHYSQHYGPRY